MVRLIAEGLVKRYDRVAVVDEASLDVPKGELAVVIGPSGSGKTTFARLIAGLETPEAGELFFDDQLAVGLPPAERRIGLMTQDEALWPHLSIEENIGYGLRAKGIARRDRRARIADVVDQLGLQSVVNLRPHETDPLHRRRAELARALVEEPSLLLLDEPTGPLAPRERDEFLDELRRLHAATGRTTVILTSSRDDAFAVAERLAVMDLGKIVQVGAPTEVYNRPVDAFVAQLLGSINLLQGQVAGTDARGELVVRTTIGRMVGRDAGRGSATIGTPVTVAIRPEAIRFGPSLPPDANRFSVTVERQVFQGPLRRIDLRAPGDWPLTASALQAQLEPLREGQTLTVAVPPEQVVVLRGRYATKT